MESTDMDLGLHIRNYRNFVAYTVISMIYHHRKINVQGIAFSLYML